MQLSMHYPGKWTPACRTVAVKDAMMSTAAAKLPPESSPSLVPRISCSTSSCLRSHVVADIAALGLAPFKRHEIVSISADV